MSRKGTSFVMKQQIKEMLSQGVPIRKIALALKISRNTIRRIIRIPEQEDRAPQIALAPLPAWLAAMPVQALVEKRRKGRSIKALYQEYQPPISYSSFVRAMARLCTKAPTVTPRLLHKPGEKTFVDYCDGIRIIDRSSGEFMKTQFFCGVLPFSGLTFGEFCANQKLESFIASHERMWSYFGGVTPYVVIDNLKSGVQNAHRYDPEVNPTYCDYANTRGFAVLPARPYKPRDKAAVEAAIGVIQRTFFQSVADRNFYSLAELNQSFREFLDRFNSSIMKDYGVSRRSRFEEEVSLLRSIVIEPYEISQWKEVKVHPDCHVQVMHNFYSVPFVFVGQKLRVRIRKNMIEIFTAAGDEVAAHCRLTSRGAYSTCDTHYPEKQRQLRSFDLKAALARAETCGTNLRELIHVMFEDERPLRRLRTVQGILRLVQNGRFSTEAVEYAASQCLTFRKYRLGFFTSCAQNALLAQQRSISTAPFRELSYLYLHGKGE